MSERRLKSRATIVTIGLGVAIGILAGCGQNPNPPVVPAIEVPAPEPDLFEDVTAKSGIKFSYRNGEEVTPPHLSILESLGGGGAAIDYDGDGQLDLFLTGGGHFTGPDNKQIAGNACRLYRNRGDFNFEDVTDRAGLGTLADGKPWFYSHGVAVADYDRDGWPDLLVTGWGRIALFHNEPAGTGGRKFVDKSREAGFDSGITWATSAAWADFDGDGFPDLYVCQYVDWSFANHPSCNYDGKTPDVCPPKKFKGLPHKVYRNTGTGTFVETGTAAGLRTEGDGAGAGKGLGVLVLDVDADGKPDVYVANDTVANFLYVNRSEKGKIRFEEKSMIAGVALDGSGQPNGSMGLDAGDPERTGKPFLWVTNYENEYHALYRNLSARGRASFLFATEASGIAAIGQKFVGWGTAFVDVDNDGREDLVISNGHAVRYPTGTTRKQKPVLMMNLEGRFVDRSERLGAYGREQHLGRGAVFADFDNDGRIDIALCNMNEPVALLRNVSPAGHHWLGIDLQGRDRSDVVGARVTVEAGGQLQYRFAKGGGSYASSGDRRLVFGLGPAAGAVKLTVEWPDTSRQEWTNVPLDRYHRVQSGNDALLPPGR